MLSTIHNPDTFGFQAANNFFGPSYPQSQASHSSFGVWGTAVLNEWLSPSLYDEGNIGKVLLSLRLSHQP